MSARVNEANLRRCIGQTFTIQGLKEAGFKVKAQAINPKFNTLTAASIFVSCPASGSQSNTVLFLVDEGLLKHR